MIPKASVVPKQEGRQQESLKDAEAATKRGIRATPLLDGRLITGLKMVANNPQDVFHALGRQPKGWFVADYTGATVQDVSRDKWNDKSITLRSANTATMAIWVF